MKSKAFGVIAVILTVTACNTPEKNKTANIDSLSNKSEHSDTSHVNTLVKDSLTNTVLPSEKTFIRSDSQSYFVLSNYYTAPETKPEHADIQRIDSTCAILIYPTDEQIATLKKETGDNFMTIADDNSYYQGLAIEMLDSINVETINAEKRFITFRGKKGKLWTLDIRKEGAPAWNLIFFNRTKAPEIIPITDLSHRKIIEYFEIKL